MIFFFQVPKSLDIASVSDWRTKKVFKSWAQKDKSDYRVGHLKTILARGGGNLNDPIFKSSNACGLPGSGQFRVDRCITRPT